jgi:tetratricopeptide (TPR) repeat protein
LTHYKQSLHYSATIALAVILASAPSRGAGVQRQGDVWQVTVRVAPGLTANARAELAAHAALLDALRYPDRPTNEPRGIHISVEAYADRQLGAETAVVRGTQVVSNVPAGRWREVTVEIPVKGVEHVTPRQYLLLRRALYDHLRSAKTIAAFDTWVGYELSSIYNDPHAAMLQEWLRKGGWPLTWPPVVPAPHDGYLYAHCRSNYEWLRRPRMKSVTAAFGEYAQQLNANPYFAPALDALVEGLKYYKLSNSVNIARAARICAENTMWPDPAGRLAVMLPVEELNAAASLLLGREGGGDVPRAWDVLYSQMLTSHPAATVCLASYGTTNSATAADKIGATNALQQGCAAYANANFDLAKARQWFLEAMDAAPMAYEPYMYVGACLAFGNRPQEALPFLWAACRLNPCAAEAQTHLALTYSKLGWYRVAQARMHRAYALEPSNMWITAKYQLLIPAGETNAP